MEMITMRNTTEIEKLERWKVDWTQIPAKLVRAEIRVFCAWCKAEKINGIWNEPDPVNERLSHNISSHGICTTCASGLAEKSKRIGAQTWAA
jgi:hypothetical protein